MDEEEMNELGQLAEEIADQGFDNIDTGPTIENYDGTLEEAIVEALTGNDVRVDAPEMPQDVIVGGTDSSHDPVNSMEWEDIDEPDPEPEEERDFIAPNVSSSVVEETTARFSSAEWFEKMQQQSIILAGLGGIGSWTTLLLGRCHPRDILLFDDDIIETVNMAGQLYGLNNIGRRKSVMSVELLNNYCNYNTVQQYGRYDENNHPTTNVMICGFDNMQARKYFYGKWKAHVMRSFTPENCLFIDGRLNAEEWQVFAIRGTDKYRMEEYERDWLFDDEDVEEALCSYKQTSFCASMIASYMVNIFVNFVANLCDPVIERDVPFLTEYSAPQMYLKTQQ